MRNVGEFEVLKDVRERVRVRKRRKRKCLGMNQHRLFSNGYDHAMNHRRRQQHGLWVRALLLSILHVPFRLHERYGLHLLPGSVLSRARTTTAKKFKDEQMKSKSLKTYIYSPPPYIL